MASRLRALDGLRGLLALYILAGHSLPLLWPVPGMGWFSALASHGRAAVDLFFCLSGLVILHSVRAEGMAGPSGARRFLGLRAGRLLPVYALALGVAVVSLAAGNPYPLMPWLAVAAPQAQLAVHVILAPGWPADAWAHLGAHLIMVQGLLPSGLLPDAEYAILGPAWSLSTEWQFYALIALLLAGKPALLRPAGRSSGVAGLLLLLGLIGLALPLLPAPWHFGRAFLPREAWYFALGMASAPLLEEQTATKAALAGYGLVLGAALALSFIAGGGPAMLVPLAWSLCILAQRRGALPFRVIGFVLTRPWLRHCGAISYPLYLLHVPVQRLLMLALAPLAQGSWPLFSLLWGPLAFALPLGLAALTHRYLEEPARRWSRDYLAKPRRMPLSPCAAGSNTSAVGRP
jgi:peptidoglycan/LPS O-acetylase OafA/YrhL